METLSTDPDLLIVLSKNLGVEYSRADIVNRRNHLSRESRMNALAAGQLWQPGMDILFSSGKTNGEGIPSEAALMIGYFRRKFRHIPETNILSEEKSHDTPTNAKQVAKLLSKREGESYQHISLLSVGYHLKRAQTLFERYGVGINEVFASEEVISRPPQEDTASESSRYRHLGPYVEDWANTEGTKSEESRELLYRRELIFDRRGYLPRLYTFLTRF